MAHTAVDGRLARAPALRPDASAQTLKVSGSFQVTLVFALIMVAVWTPRSPANAICSVLGALCILWFTVRSRYSVRELGLARPGSGAMVMLLSAVFMIVVIVLAGSVIRRLEPSPPMPLERVWKYFLWALEQEFILQSFFYVRLESILGSRRAVWGAALLFSIVHLPSPVLTLMSFIGGLLFCEMFRRYRNIFPLGLVHGSVGLTLAASLPDRWLHHMHVGIGYLSYRP